MYLDLEYNVGCYLEYDWFCYVLWGIMWKLLGGWDFVD